MKSSSILILVMFSVLGCGGGSADESETFDNIQDCVDEHSMTEGLSAPNAITICILDHVVIDGAHLEFATASECETYCTDNLAGYAAADITAGCEDYIVQKDM